LATNELAEKVRYCVQAIRSIQWLTGLMPDDHSKRLVARMTFLYVDAFLKLAPQLKNRLRETGANVSEVHREIGQLTTDYESFYARIRDKLTAHRQEMDIADLIEAWNENDLVTLTVFSDEIFRLYSAMSSMHSDVPDYEDMAGVNAEATEKIVRDGCSDVVTDGVTAATDCLAITRPQTVTIIPTCDLQRKVMQIISIIDTFKFTNHLHGLFIGCSDLKRIVRAMLVIDAINLIDNVFPRTGNGPEHVSSLLEIARNEGSSATEVLETAATLRDAMAEGRVRVIRNKIAAHVDAVESLRDLLQRLDALAGRDLSAIVNHGISTINKFCVRGDMANILLIHGKQLKNYDSVKSHFSKPF
jgi:hypothetical protein